MIEPPAAPTPLPRVTRRTTPSTPPDGVILLDFDARQKCRQRVVTSDGEPLALLLARGETLEHGDCLLSEDARVFRVEAAEEELSLAVCPDAASLARAAYHLGNRHTRIHIEAGCILYQRDHVLDGMLRRFGLVVTAARGPFEPEPGAYHGQGHRHEHEHEHEHEHRHGHDGDPEHALGLVKVSESR